MNSEDKSKIEQIIKRCQIGDGRWPEEANNLLSNCYGALGAQAKCIDRLEAELDGLKADAERYRWLRDENNWGEDSGPDCWPALGEASGQDFDCIVDGRRERQGAGE